ncbi:Mth938-like domain-containing protein [Uliginosibacterium sp. H1]|uniref:Mth938-like domain-containing protein n=1 Tax=Uliginosibacterium sp. H1 TaxID=3114757 RepID=UPI002E179CC8|nr:Mth938-like domain-containing protein [Uliginosibacterium sp. H1]
MKLHRDSADGTLLIQRYDSSGVVVAGETLRGSVVLTPQAVIGPWARDRDSLVAADFAALLEQAPGVVLIGTGKRQHFPAPALLRPLIEAGVGWEVMDTGSACRTYNVLASEGRKVLAALLFEE